MTTTFPPTEKRLNELRQSKIAPISKDLTTFIILLTLFLIVFIGQTEIYHKLSAVMADPEKFNFFATLLSVLIIFLAPLLVLAALSALAQTKGICGFSQNQELINKENRLIERVFKFLAGATKALGLIYIIYIYTLSYFNNFQDWNKLYKDFVLTDKAFVLPALDLLLNFKELALAISAICLFYALTCALISSIFVRVYFRYKHRMTREELQAEILEQQIRPEIRNRLPFEKGGD
ncbi:MAG: EscU/YscU/HrcU family type III secretion system export apparatus switch protein [Deltaproteobacteria bacterium]|jgi:flagellar biosynthesis protein FlhB|nr:EscU/YscU/HrcU family type III secretion system export apparatus switch protein [Deltaproteobacteria bacterium]